MTEPKPSGLRPPSKIGRPCSTMPPRPAIPPSPLRPSTNQMEPLWESHGRQINEAGLRRGSDTSVVLTEDTDSFKIGDRVWVGGTKPGTIAYIGETKFAPRDWAGVVLDEPIGKNDGSVAGSRYFQCEPKRGIFSRLTRLTRLPLGDHQTGMITTPLTPPESTSGGFYSKSMSPSLNASMTSLSSTTQKGELRIGDRVIVSSSQGSKTGVLRYLGITEFSAGEWCGVELDEPIGKNDGSVNDKRYFECSPKHGLFAPVHKVSRSPSSKRPSICVVHKPTGGAALNASLSQKKSGSRESLASSLASSLVSVRTSGTASGTATREVLKEKQQEIECLRKERDLERERVTKAANQADQAEHAALSIKQEYEKYREQMQRTASEAELTVAQLLSEKSALVVQLEEEKRKCEDLLFRFEEESVNKDDIQKARSEQSVINTVNESRIRELEEKLAEERRERAAQTERDSIKLFEAEEELARLRNEVSCATNSQNSHLQDLESRNRSLEEMKNSLEKEVREKSSLVGECVERIRELEVVLSKAQRESATDKESSGSRLEKELGNVKQNLQDKEKLVENMKLEFERNTSALNEELRESTETIETMKRENLSERDSLLLEYRQMIEEKTEELENKSKKLLEQQNAALEGLKSENVNRIRELSESFEQQLRAKDTKIEGFLEQLGQKTSETERLLTELAAERELCKNKDEELISALRKLEELNTRLKLAEDNNSVLSKQIQDYRSKNDDNIRIIHEKQTLEQNLATSIASEEESNARLNKLNEELKVKDKELMELRNTTLAQIEEITKRFEAQINDKTKYIEEISTDVAQKALMLIKLEKDIADLKAIIASKDEDIKHLLGKTSELQDAFTLSEQTKTNLESELRVFETNVRKLNQQIARAEEKVSQLSSQKEKLESDIASAISTSADSSEQLSKYNEDLRRKEKELDEAREKIFQTEGRLSNTETELKKNMTLVEQLRSEKSNLELQIDKTKQSNVDYIEKIHEYEQEKIELSVKVKEGEDAKKNLKEMSGEITDLTERLKKRDEEVVNLRGECEDLQNSYQEQASLLQKKFTDLSTELATLQDEMKNLQKCKSKLEAEQSANRWSIEELTEKLKSESDKTSKLENSAQEKDSKLQDVQNKLLELQKIHDALINDKATADMNLTTSLNTMSSTVEELGDKLKNAEGTIKDKTDEVSKMRAEIEKSQIQVAELNATISSMKEEHTCNGNELKNAQEVIAQKESKINELSETKTVLENSVKSQEIQISNLHEELNRREQSQAEVEVEVKESETAKREEMLTLRNSLECEVAAKRRQIDDMNKQNEELRDKLRLSQDVIDKHKTDLNDKEVIIDELKMQVKVLEDAQVERAKAEQQLRNEEIKLKQNELSGANRRIHELQRAVNTLEKQLREQETKSADLARTVENNEKEVNKNVQNLQEKLNVAKVEETRLLDELSRLEKENKQVTAKWIEATNQLKLSHENLKNTYDGTGDTRQHIVAKDIDVAKLQEENDTARSQIDFLNSVIVDMQRKNESLLCKIEVLEIGVPANEAEDYTRSTLDKRTAAPRMFCDICDQFDLHETEDCPRQAQDFTESTERTVKTSKKQSVERPYCENCEIFGHDTRDCDDAETF